MSFNTANSLDGAARALDLAATDLHRARRSGLDVLRERCPVGRGGQQSNLLFARGEGATTVFFVLRTQARS